MKKLALLCIIAASVVCHLSAYGQEDRAPRLGNYDSVSIHVPAQTVIIRGNDRSLDIDMSDSTARKVDIFNDRGTLVIKSKGNGWIRRSDDIRIRITMPYWETLSTGASGSLRSEDHWSLDNIRIRSTGSCDISLNDLETRSAEISLSGSGNISVNELMASDSFTAGTTGSGNILIHKAYASETEIKLTGSGDMNSSVETKNLTARLTGSGDLRISGYAALAELHTTGSGSIDGAGLRADEANIRITGSGDVSLRDDSRIKEIRMTGSGVFRSR